jgi:hypothetical protein
MNKTERKITDTASVHEERKEGKPSGNKLDQSIVREAMEMKCWDLFPPFNG